MSQILYWTDREIFKMGELMKIATMLILIFFSPLTWSQSCNYGISFSTFQGQIQDTQQTIAHSLTISRPGNTPTPNCSQYRVFFGTGNAGSYARRAQVAGEDIPYNIYSDSSRSHILKDFADANTGEYLAGATPQANTQYTQNFYIGLPNLEEIFSSGANVYFDLIPIHFYAVRNNGNIEFQTTRYLSILITIPRFAQLSLIPENAPFDPSSVSQTLNFGSMSTGQELGVDLRVRGNVPFGIYMSSQNGSRLVRGHQHVNYQVNVANQGFRSLTPAGATLYITQNNQRTDLEGERYNIRARLGDVSSDLESGIYQDVITITVQAW